MVTKRYPHTGNIYALPDLVPARTVSTDRGCLGSTTVKRLKPGAPGTKRLVERYGHALLCVRYRTDPESGRRFTTVELVVEERDGPPTGDVWVRVGYGEADLRQQIKTAGATWDHSKKLWRMPAKAAKAMKLEKRIVKNIQ